MPLCAGSARLTPVVHKAPMEAAKQHPVWEKEIESLDQKELELHQTQNRLIREHMASFNQQLAEIREDLRTMHLQRDGDVAQLELIWEQLNRDKQDVRDELTSKLEASQVKLKERLDGLEHVLEASQEIDGASAPTSARRKSGESVPLVVRLDACSSIEQVHGESADWTDMDGLKFMHSFPASLQERFNYIEQVLGESNDRCAEEFVQIRQTQGLLQSKLADIDRQGSARQSSALAELRRAHGLWPTQRGLLEATQTILKERVDALEQLVNDSGTQVEAMQAKLQGTFSLLAGEKHRGW